MKHRAQERVEHHKCPEFVARELKLAGGTNCFGEPMFRVVWGYDRIVPMTGEWQDFEQFAAKLTDRFTNYSQTRVFTKLKSSVIETRQVPKYLPANCWHLEMWRPPEEYGKPEDWRKQGEEVVAGLTVDTAGEYPSRGEYELCYPLTDDGTSSGRPLPLVAAVVAEIVRSIVYGKNNFNFAQRRAAIEQRVLREEQGFVRKTMDILRDGMKPFAGESFVTVQQDDKEST